MNKLQKTFSMVRLNRRSDGFAVIDDRTGALARPKGALALKLTAEQANELVKRLNAADARAPRQIEGDRPSCE